MTRRVEENQRQVGGGNQKRLNSMHPWKSVECVLKQKFEVIVSYVNFHVQLNPTITDVKGFVNFACYRRILENTIERNKKSDKKGLRLYVD